jgi:hypothetical protein
MGASQERKAYTQKPTKAWHQLLTHAYNPSYSGVRDQEDLSSRLAWANSWQDTTSKIPNTKKGLAEWLQCLSACPKFKSQAPVPPQKTQTKQ